MTRRSASADAWGSLLRVHAALVPRLDERLKSEAGLSLSWYDVLLELNSAPDRRLRMTDLGERVVLSRTRVSRIVDELQRAGLVAREENDADRRSAYAAMTADGRRAFLRAAPKYVDAIEQEFAASLTVDELRSLDEALSRVIAHSSGRAADRPSG
jgi:DNA-binding MarR family transcriptional regulator